MNNAKRLDNAEEAIIRLVENYGKRLPLWAVILISLLSSLSVGLIILSIRL